MIYLISPADAIADAQPFLRQIDDAVILLACPFVREGSLYISEMEAAGIGIALCSGPMHR
ncbi:MAG: DUF1232 domain-containing protein [Desulfobacteraceae bacterium]|nr:DUF1232 domain-containing protein [Desulfobacteraceae bacterium]